MSKQNKTDQSLTKNNLQKTSKSSVETDDPLSESPQTQTTKNAYAHLTDFTTFDSKQNLTLNKNNINLKQYERIKWIHETIKQTKIVTFEDYYRSLGCSSRTFYRDIEKLKNFFDAPIKINKEKKYYYYTEETFELPMGLLKQDELFSLVFLNAFLEQYKNAPFLSTLEYILQKIASSFTDDIKQYFKDINIEQKYLRQLNWDYINKISKAIINQQQLQITYHSFNSQEISQRIVDPYLIFNYQGDFYLLAFCHKKNKFLNFFIGRIKKLDILKKRFEKKDLDLDKYFYKYRMGIIREGKLEKIHIKITKKRAQWAQEKYKSLLKELKQDDKFIYYELTTYVNKDFFDWVLMQHDEIEILSPKHVRQQFQDLIKRIKNIYEK